MVYFLQLHLSAKIESKPKGCEKMSQIKLLFSPLYWFKKIAQMILKPFAPAFARAKSFAHKHLKASLAMLVMACALVATAYYCGTWLFAALAFAALGVLLMKMKKSMLAGIFFTAAAIALIIPGAKAAIKTINASGAQSEPATQTEAAKEKPAAGKKTIEKSSTDGKASTSEAGKADNTGTTTPPPVNTSPAPYPPPDELPAIETPLASGRAIPPTTPSAEDASTVAKQMAKAVVGVAYKKPAGRCGTDMDESAPSFQYGEILIILQHCDVRNSQIHFSGRIMYQKSDDRGSGKRLLVFHAFRIRDNTGRDYTVQSGKFGTSDSFGKGYSYQWIYPDDTIAFSFVAGTADTDSPPDWINVTLPWNQSEGAVAFTKLSEVK